MAKSTTAVENAVLAPVAAAPDTASPRHPGNSIHLTLQEQGRRRQIIDCQHSRAVLCATSPPEIICIDTGPGQQDTFFNTKR